MASVTGCHTLGETMNVEERMKMLLEHTLKVLYHDLCMGRIDVLTYYGKKANLLRVLGADND